VTEFAHAGKRPLISAVINTLNEEMRLPYALRSLEGWVDEIVVVDMYSDDRTAAIAMEHGARVVSHPRTGYVEPARRFALAQASGEWILIIDADEVVPRPLGRRLREIAKGSEWDVVSIPWLNYLLGRPMMHAGWGPDQDRHSRFFRSGLFTASDEIHAYGSFEVSARILQLPYSKGYAVVHFNYTDIHQFVAKLNRYTEAEAGRKSLTGSIWRVMASAAKEFARRFIKQQGWRDGWRGFYLSALMAGYKIIEGAKARQLSEAGSKVEIEAHYRAEAERWLQMQDD
jgi:glycosyltransferase involved in cell wall biosynthesis